MVLVLVATSTASISHEELDANAIHVDVHVMSFLPVDSESMKIHCRSKYTDLGVHTINPGEEYKWVALEKALYQCNATWNRRIASWNAYQPKREMGNQTVFWMVAELGMLISWDKRTWLIRSTWRTTY